MARHSTRTPPVGPGRPRDPIPAALMALLAAGTLFQLAGPIACGPPAEVVIRKAPPKPAEPPPRDYFDEFGGHRVPAGQAFRIANDPLGVDDVRVVVALQKTEWLSRTRADGGEEREAIAHVLVVKGQAENIARLRIHVGEAAADLGVRVEVRDAGEVYDETTMRWTAYAELVVSAE